MKKYIGLLVLCLSTLYACQDNTYWEFSHDINLDEVSPNGVVFQGENLWISDTDNNQLVLINQEGKILKRVEDLDRPMHISSDEGSVFIADYGSDQILKMSADGVMDTIALVTLPDGPAGIDVQADKLIVADFYNHQIIYQDGNKNNTFGTKGKEGAGLHYPTDVQFFNDLIYVADAYNNLVKIFDMDGQYRMTIGKAEEMTATTGVYVNTQELITVDFENDRVITYDHKGKLLDIMDEGFHGPTDIITKDDQLYVLNFKGKFISVFNKS